MPFVFGVMMDRVGVGITLILFSIINTIGQFVVWYGAKINNFIVMLAGRIIFGFTGDAMSVAQSAMITLWFSGAELNFAFAIAVSTGRIASILNSYTAPWLYRNWGLDFLCLTSSLLCVVSLVNGVACYLLEVYAERAFKKVK